MLHKHRKPAASRENPSGLRLGALRRRDRQNQSALPRPISPSVCKATDATVTVQLPFDRLQSSFSGILWRRLSLIASLFVQCAIGQTDGSARRHEKTAEENLRYLAVIKGRPDPGMSLADQMLRLHVPGVGIAVIHDKRIDWSKGYGVARLGGPPVSASTMFGAASMSKPVTAMAVLRLVQEGKIDLDVDVNTYLKSWKIPANEYTKNHAVTVRELLSHTSGIGTHIHSAAHRARRIATSLANGQRAVLLGFLGDSWALPCALSVRNRRCSNPLTH